MAAAHVRRAAAGLLALSAFAASLGLATRAKAQGLDASPLAFRQIEAAAGPAGDRPGRRRAARPGAAGAPALVETGRRVHVQLPPPPPFVRGRLVCAVNVNRYLARLGQTGTGSALAHSFLRWGRASGPVAGAVQVERRRGGGHVKIVAGGGQCWNPSASRQRWVLTPCAPARVVAWRAA
jgi:hypothetical protein